MSSDNNSSVEIQLQTAKQLIQNKRYEEARSLLITVDHPTADKWLARLNTISAPNSPLPPPPQNTFSQRPQSNYYQANVPRRNIPAVLQALDDEISSRQSQKNAATIVFIFCLLLSPLGIGIILLPFSLFNYFRHKNKLNKLKSQRLMLLQEQY